MTVLRVKGPFHGPRGAELRRTVQMLLHRGERRIVLCLARVATLDAAGVGELVRTRNMAAAADGLFRITSATGHVRTLLNRLGLLEVLSADREPDARCRVS